MIARIRHFLLGLTLRIIKSFLWIDTTELGSATAINKDGRREETPKVGVEAKFTAKRKSQEKIIASSTTEISSSCSGLPDEIWRYVLRFLTPYDLCFKTSLLNKTFYDFSLGQHDSNTDDEICMWKVHCENRWKGKQNIHTFLSKTTMSWKQKFAKAEIDILRNRITEEELCRFRWKLIYNGRESGYGLRKFSSDGTYESVYGVCEWVLFQDKLCFMGLSLPIERDPVTWGWTIGKNTRTVYTSQEKEDEEIILLGGRF